MISSNNDWVIPAGMKERRFFVLNVSDSHRGDRDYFNVIFDQVNNGGREAMFHDLLRMNLTGINLRDVPTTGALSEQKLLSAGSIVKFWYSRLQAGSQLLGEEWNDLVATELLHEQYVRWSRSMGFGRAEDISVFSRELRKMCPEIGGPKRMCYTTKADGITVTKRGSCLLYPDLNVCRQFFEEFTVSNISWPEDEGQGY
jgi:hypothetical protein